MIADHRPILDYHRPHAPRAGERLRSASEKLLAWLTSLPLWALALILTVPPWLIDQVGVLRHTTNASRDWQRAIEYFLQLAALFVAGAVARRAGRQVLVMLACAAAWVALRVFARDLWPQPRHPYNLVVWLLPILLTLGVAEWLMLAGRSSWARLVWLVLLILAAVCFIKLVTVPLSLTGEVKIPLLGPTWRMTTWGALLHGPLVAIITWVAVPYAAKVAADRSGRHKTAALLLFGGSVTGFVIFFHVLIYPIARASLLDGVPFDESSAFAILEMRGRPEETERMWQAVATPSWPRDRHRHYDLRRHVIRALVQRDPAAAADRLAALLREHPHRQTANISAKLLAGEREYDATAALLRYALLGDECCVHALETMGVPEAALGRLALARHTDGRMLSRSTRQTLATALGRDVGPADSDWQALYDAVAPTLPSPLSTEQAAQVQSVRRAFDRLRAVGGERAFNDFVGWDVQDLEAAVDHYVASLGRSRGLVTTTRPRPR